MRYFLQDTTQDHLPNKFKKCFLSEVFVQDTTQDLQMCSEAHLMSYQDINVVAYCTSFEDLETSTFFTISQNTYINQTYEHRKDYILCV
jgi:hypothetical protein